MKSIFLTLGPITIYWYSIFILLALIIGVFLVIKEGKKHNISTDLIVDLAFYLVPIAIIGARIYYVIFNFDYYASSPIEIFYIWEGGLAIHGAIIAGLAYLAYFCYKHKIKLLLMTDILVISLFLGQAIGRWGNFMNGEAFGPATTLSHLHDMFIPDFIIKGMNINGVYHIPTFYYESLGCIFGFIILLIIRRYKKLKIGQLTSFYLIWYGLIRFFIESLRTDSLMLGSLKMAQIVSIAMIGIGIITWIHSKKEKIDYHKEVIADV